MRRSKREMVAQVLAAQPEAGHFERVANNTLAYAVGGDRLIRLHETNILIFSGKGTITLNSGGWQTVTTRDRINRFLPPGWYITQRKWEWTVTTPFGAFPYYDWMTFDRATGAPL